MPLEIKGLSKRYGNKWVLRDVEFSAIEGRILGLLGGTASGKSTLLDLIAGETRDNGGSVSLDGADLFSVRPRERGVTLLPERKKPPIIGLFTSKPHSSSGEAVLNGFEDALAKAGKVILLDDPFSGLDRELRFQAFAAIRRAARQRDRVVILATADFDQLTEVADDIAVLAQERIVQTGTPQDVYEDPKCVASATLTGGG
ncbi:MAG TPA: ATP-binding cassette domain-containing protein, partial [Pyrinomonadaceae bacterium]|nr:ATP-binding cassette domain-containing protein [Pyrinomonadaceae bacterium]